MINDWWYDN